jgi:hypothetical protein
MSFYDSIKVIEPKKSFSAYDFLKELVEIHNIYPDAIQQSTYFPPRLMYLVDIANKLDIKYKLDVFEYAGNDLNLINRPFSPKLANLILFPNPQAKGPATVFVAHHDVANIHSQNTNDNSASVCHLLHLARLINDDPENSRRTIIIFTSAEECGGHGARRFAQNIYTSNPSNPIINHNLYGPIDAVINLELTGVGTEIWSDSKIRNPKELALYNKLETAFNQKIHLKTTPFSDAVIFRNYNYPIACLGLLASDDLKDNKIWFLCHKLEDTINRCASTNDMQSFTNKLHDFTKIYGPKDQPTSIQSATSVSNKRAETT